jgi:hypothetical protein
MRLLLALLIPASLFAQSAATTNYKPALAGIANGRTVEAKLQESLSVNDFKADPLGIADSTIPVQNAIVAAGIEGASVRFSAGTYLLGAISMARFVPIICDSEAVTLLPDANSITMFTFTGVSYSGMSGCAFTGNSKTGVTGILTQQTGGAQVSTNLAFRDLYMQNLDTCYSSTNTYFTSMDNVRCLTPTTAGFDVDTNSNDFTCTNCTVLSGSTLTLCLRLHGAFGVTWTGGYFEGACNTTIDQNNATVFTGVVWENATGTTESQAIQIGNNGGAATSRGTVFHGCVIGGASDAFLIYQTEGLEVTGNDIRATAFAFFIVNNGTNLHRGINFGNNSYFLPSGYDPTKIVAYNVAPSNVINDNINQEVVNPLLFTPTLYGSTLAIPPDASLANGQSVLYPDQFGVLWVKAKDASGNISYQGLNNGIIGPPGTGGSLTVNTPSLNAGFPSGLVVNGAYNAGTKLSTVNLLCQPVQSGGGYASHCVIQTMTGATITGTVDIDSGGMITASGGLAAGTTIGGNTLAVHGAATAPGSAAIVCASTSTAVPPGGGTPTITTTCIDTGHTHTQN